MTDSGSVGDLASLEPLEPLDGGAPIGAPSSDESMLQAARGLPAPAFNAFCKDKTFYRFLFAGVVIVAGCWMPFSAEIGRAGYQTMGGGFYMLIGIATIWSWWASIANNRPVGLKWLMACAIPLIATGWNMGTFDVEAAHAHARLMGWLPVDVPYSAGWKAMLGDCGSALAKSQEAGVRAENFWRLFGPGQFFVFLGALIAELGFFAGVLGGAKKNKQDTKAKMMAAAERKRR